MLEISNLSLTIAGKQILHDVSLAVHPGRVTALIGESGSGKSLAALTAMQLLPGNACPTGSVRLCGTDLLRLDEAGMCRIRGRRIGMIFQEPMSALNQVQRIGDQIAEPLFVHGLATRSMARHKARIALGRVGLSPADVSPDRYPHQLSGGQRQRVVTAIATIAQPGFLIADEPTTALDVTTEARILELLTGFVRQDGMGLLLISHDLAVVADIADVIVVMHHGGVIESGTRDAVLAHTRHAHTRSLIDAARPRPRSARQSAARHENDRQRQALQLVVNGASLFHPLPRQGILGRRRWFRALSKVNLTMAPGERVGLVGRSGSGKSTLARVILGLEPRATGAITLGGAAIGGNPESLRHIQVVFQDPFGSFNPRHRVQRLVAEPLHLLTSPPIRKQRTQAVAAMLEAVGLSPDDAGRYIHQFSGGQRQRIAIARALIVRPRFILFDEAVSSLDVTVRARILELVERLASDFGLGYLFISHDLAVIESITDRVLVMEDGCIVEEGATNMVLQSPRHQATKALVAARRVLRVAR